MPDLNKLQALANAEFVVRRTCLRCVHFQAATSVSLWGTCAAIPYEHLKHSSDKGLRLASVPADGSCPKHELRQDAAVGLGAHIRFIEAEGKVT